MYSLFSSKLTMLDTLHKEEWTTKKLLNYIAKLSDFFNMILKEIHGCNYLMKVL